eukprot:1144548-Pelagomonas_calceolata.AAC.1
MFKLRASSLHQGPDDLKEQFAHFISEGLKDLGLPRAQTPLGNLLLLDHPFIACPASQKQIWAGHSPPPLFRVLVLHVAAALAGFAHELFQAYVLGVALAGRMHV